MKIELLDLSNLNIKKPRETSGVFLLSGGMDSTTLFAHVLKQGWTLYPVVFDYGQKHREMENKAAFKIADFYRKIYGDKVKECKVIKLPLNDITKSALLNKDLDIPDSMEEQKKTVVPHRNALMTTIASSYGIGMGVYTVFITPVLEDYNSYSDCRPIFINALQDMLRASYKDTKFPITISAPYMKKSKDDIVAWGIKNNVPYELTWTCYKNGIKKGKKVVPCGTCPSCQEREVAFKHNNMIDPLIKGVK